MTKTINNTNCAALFILFFMLQGFFLSAQDDYPDMHNNSINVVLNDFIVVYTDDATDTDMAAVRELYNVISYETINLGGRNIDIWAMNFPIDITGEEPIIDVQGLQDALSINPDALGNSEADTGIDGGSMNYIMELEDLSSDSPLSTSNPVPDCPDQLHRIVSSPQPQPQPTGLLDYEEKTNIIIFDQLISEPAYFENLSDKRLITVTSNPGGSHGTKVASVIKHTLDEAGMTNYRLGSLGVFDNEGMASFSDILKGFEKLYELNIHDAIINMSASALVFDSGNFAFTNTIWDVIGEFLVENNLLLISSASNSGEVHSSNYYTSSVLQSGGTYSPHGPIPIADYYPTLGDGYDPDELEVFPGCADLSNEITVVGLKNCYAHLADFSGANNLHFEIGAEAARILVYDGTDYYQEDGVSYATPLVSAAALQIAAELNSFDAALIKIYLLDYTDTNRKLAEYIEDGRVLNLSTILDEMNGSFQSNNLQGATSNETQTQRGEERIIITEPPSSISPNPFQSHLNINLKAFESQSVVSLKLYDLTGQLVLHKEVIPTDIVQWNMPQSLANGSYWLQVQSADEVISHKVLKL